MAQKKRKRQVRLPIFISSVVLAFVVGVFGTVILLTAHFNAQTAATGSYPAGFEKLNAVYQTIDQNYYKKVSKKKLMNGAINGMISSLGDPYSEYLTGSDAGDLNNTISGNFEGIGAEVQKAGGRIQIISPIAGSPAKKAGLRANDVIMSINGDSTSGLTVNQAVAKIRGKKGTDVKLTIKRGDHNFNVTVKRDVIPVKTVNAHIVKKQPTVGYIQITTFSNPTFKEMKTAVKKLRSEGAKSFIVDVRGNPGGLMDQALKISSMFLKNGQTIMKVQPRTGQPEVYKASKKQDGGFKITEPTTVLIDDGSASAAEIFSAALNQSAHDPLVGTKSFGKGTVQNVTNFKDKSEFKITIAKWLTPNGDWINKKGLTPTTKADYPSYAYLPVVNGKKTYQQGDVNTNIKTLQKALTALGQNPGEANGYFSPQTEQAVKAYQATAKLPQTGKLDPATIDKMQVALTQKISQNDVPLEKALAQMKK
ncbi:peptidase S41 [Loigolactobacillus backii]|uniref:Peptidase S41 n=1 Tax=Loigolactobacillus backii TaxID=375175 RepID=A0A192H3L9_9LACO|nr:S41 family peptidase [Loigolactobacillus backii]ANK62965.1 peptidase S41 [Loigolactobacillus backii]ANK70027.1 peptidase S41 [Loigolactobacillus backii]PIO83384.1 peptidase S41 [Loigolactobacillus backii]